MAARRMDISALLCGGGDNDAPNNDDPTSPHISHPVILAPHLRGKHARPMPITPPSNHNYLPGPRDVPPPPSSPTAAKTSPTDSMSDPHHRPRTIDALLHHPPTVSSPRAPPRPNSSSSSVNALLNPQPTYSPYPQKSPASASYLPVNPYPHAPLRTGLDALVHAASEERRRISGGSTASDPTSPVADRSLTHLDNPPLHPLHLLERAERQPRTYSFSYNAPSIPLHHTTPRTDDSPRPHKRIRESCSPSPPLDHIHQHHSTFSSVRSAPSVPIPNPTASALSSSLTGPGMPHLSSPANLPLSGPGITPPHFQHHPTVHRSPVLSTHHSPVVPTRMSPIVYAAMRSDRDVPRLARAVWDDEEVDGARRREAEREREGILHARERDEHELRQRLHEPALEHREDYERRHMQELEHRQRHEMDLRQRQELDLRLRQEFEFRQRHLDTSDPTMLRQREEIMRQQDLERCKGELLGAHEEVAARQVEEMRGRRQTLHHSPRDEVQRQKRDRSSHRQPTRDASLHRLRDPLLPPDDFDPRYREQLMRQREQELLRQQELELVRRQDIERELQRQEVERRQGEELLRQQEEAAAQQMEEMRVRQAEQRRREEVASKQKVVARRREAEEAQRHVELAQRLRAETEQRQREEVARIRREEEIEDRRREEELEKRREAEALERRRQEEEAQRQRAEEEIERQRQEEEIERQRQEEETKRRRQEEVERQRQEEEVDRQRQEEEDAQRLRAAELRQHAEADRQRLEREQRRREEDRKRQEEGRKRQEELQRIQREMMLHRQREEALLKQKEEARQLREEEDRQRKQREQAERKEREELERKRLKEAEQQAQQDEAERKQREEAERQRAELERKRLEEIERQQREATEKLLLAEESERKQQEDQERKQREELERQRLAEEQRQREELQWKQREETLRRQQEELASQQQQELERRQQLEQMQLDDLQQNPDLGRDADAELNTESKDHNHEPHQNLSQPEAPHDVLMPSASRSSSPTTKGSLLTRSDSAERNLPPMYRGKAKVDSPPLLLPLNVPSKVEEQEMRIPSPPTHATPPTVTQGSTSPPSPTHPSSSWNSPAGPSSACQSPPHKPDSSSMDVDEELLSLVEDRPTSHPKAARLKPKRSPSPQRLFPLDEEIMPPPPAAPAPAKKKAEPVKAGKKKVTTAPKPAPKPKPPPKPRTKPPPKTKGKEPTPKDVLKNSLLAKHAAASRSRSASVMPVDVMEEPEAEEDSDREDDKLYCVCKTRYDEDRVMIACDRCDEWYHTQCVHMPDLEVDLVDQFICPLCIQNNPQLNLQTTYKRRCFFGLRHTDPSSPSACHKPSRGAFSKYCSDECGVKYMQMSIAQWEQNGGKPERLWETVKNAEKREGVVVCADAAVELEGKPFTQKRKADGEIARLNARLEDVVKEREMMKREMDMIVWRERLVELASERAERVDECGWDQRLCFGEEEWADFGAEVLESYEEKGKEDAMEEPIHVDGATTSHGEWWCTGKKKCERHAGWQKLRAAEVSFDKETKESILSNLTTREREIRKGIEDILYPQSSNTSQTPAKPSPANAPLNGSSKPRINGEAAEKGKKKRS